MSDASRVRVFGPLAGQAPGMLGYLTERGYGPRSAVEHLRRLAMVSRHLDSEGLEVGAVDEALIGRFLVARQASGLGAALTVRSFRLVLAGLRSMKVMPWPPARVVAPVEVLLEDYRGYLVAERSLAASTVVGYMSTAGWFLSEACGNDPQRVGSLSAKDVSVFVVDAGRVRSPRSVNEVVVGVRSLLRYFYVKGLIDVPLAQAAPWLARGRTSSLPRTLEPGTAELLLSSCDRDTLVGARDFAVVTVLARLGLRAGEVSAMELRDIDWRRGELLVRSKGGWRDPLPIPVDVGAALTGYLSRSDRDGVCRHVFVRVRAPGGQMAMTDVRAVVRRACKRVGIGDTSTHRLRHAVASDMLRHGAPLHEIGQVLRHRDVETTAVYAKVDFVALATLAQPWPRSGS